MWIMRSSSKILQLFHRAQLAAKVEAGNRPCLVFHIEKERESISLLSEPSIPRFIDGRDESSRDDGGWNRVWGGVVRSHPSNNPTYKLDCLWNVETERWCRRVVRREEDEVREARCERDSLQIEEERKNAVG
ncbi:uncharacterized protein LOC102672331 [Apis dorsata]|uniref:uncharacterized protein LOC102672331 n=1 Tax=Apis dorsata TaxID=7462 RepID=UPI0003DF7ECD|nr:uncharacterized protein LOC102672331 [Apis dorsata]